MLRFALVLASAVLLVGCQGAAVHADTDTDAGGLRLHALPVLDRDTEQLGRDPGARDVGRDRCATATTPRSTCSSPSARARKRRSPGGTHDEPARGLVARDRHKLPGPQRHVPAEAGLGRAGHDRRPARHARGLELRDPHQHGVHGRQWLRVSVRVSQPTIHAATDPADKAIFTALLVRRLPLIVAGAKAVGLRNNGPLSRSRPAGL